MADTKGRQPVPECTVGWVVGVLLSAGQVDGRGIGDLLHQDIGALAVVLEILDGDELDDAQYELDSMIMTSMQQNMVILQQNCLTRP